MSGNGVDLSGIYRVVLALDRKLDTFAGKTDARLGELSGQLAALREEVAAYQGAVVGHGILIGGLDERVTRLEERDQPPGKAA